MKFSPYHSLLFLATMTSALNAATLNLLDPAWRTGWQLTTEKETPLKMTFEPNTGWMTVSRPGAIFNPVVLATHFGATGPIPVGSKTPAEVTLAKVGDTIGTRMVISYNTDACKGCVNMLRLGFFNSGGTRQDNPLSVIESPVFADDQGWCIHFCSEKVQTTVWERPPVVAGKPGTIPTSLRNSVKATNWTKKLPAGFMKPNQPVEVIFSLTRAGPNEIKIYGFIGDLEFEHTATGVTNFTFDSLYYHFPNGSADPGAAFTIREYQLMTP